MMQIIQKVIKDGSDIEMVLLFSNVLEEDILLKERYFFSSKILRKVDKY